MKKFYEFKDIIDYEKEDIASAAVDQLNDFIERNPNFNIISTHYSVMYVNGFDLSYPLTSILVEVEE